MSTPQDQPMTSTQAREILRLAKAVTWKHQKDIQKGRIPAVVGAVAIALLTLPVASAALAGGMTEGYRFGYWQGRYVAYSNLFSTRNECNKAADSSGERLAEECHWHEL